MIVTYYMPAAPTRVVVEPVMLGGGWTTWEELVAPAEGVPEAYLYTEVALALDGLLDLLRWAADDDGLVGLIPAAEVPGVLARVEAALAGAELRAPWARNERFTRARPTVVVEPGGLRRLVPGRVVAIEWAVTDEQLVTALAGVRAVLARAVQAGWGVGWG